MKLTSLDLKELGVVDYIIKEPLNTAYSDIEAVSSDIKKYVVNRLNFYKDFSKDDIVSHRYNKFRNIGVY